MALHLRIMGGTGDHSKLESLLREKFDRWTEDVHVDLIRYADGWVIVSAMASISSGLTGDPTRTTSRIVMEEVRDVLKDAGEPITQ